MDEKIKVLYDTSILGEGWLCKKARTGVLRVSEEMLYALNASDQCELLYCANKSALSWCFGAEYLRHNPRIKSSDSLCENKWLKATNRLNASIVNTRNVGLIRLGEMFLNIFENSLVDPKALKEAEIHHSVSYHSIPSQIREAKHIKKFFFVHDLIPILYPHLSNPYTTALLMYYLEELHKDSFFLCNSHCTKMDLCQCLPGLDPARVFVLHLGASDSFSPSYDLQKKKSVLQKFGLLDKPYIISVGTFDIRKNYVHLVRCFQDLVRQEGLEDLRLLLVGGVGGIYSDSLKEVDDKMKDKIIFTGYIDDDELLPLYSGALAYVTVSLYEGFSIPTLEAMKCGLPVITANTSVFPEVVGDAGIMVDPTDSDALKSNILRLYKDESLRKIMSQKGIERSKAFTWEKCAQDLISAYRTVLKK